MAYVGIRGTPPSATVEVDGPLDQAGAYDLRRAVQHVIRDGWQRVHLDLSRVGRVDDAALDVLVWCFEHAAVEGVDLKVSSLSAPAARSRALTTLAQRHPVERRPPA